MYYLLADDLPLMTLRILQRLKQQGHAVLLVLTENTQCSSERFAAANLNPDTAVYYQDLGLPRTPLEAAPALKLSADLKANRLSSVETDYLDAAGQLQLQAFYRYNHLWRAVYHPQADAQKVIENYDTRGYLVRRRTQTTDIYYQSSGKKRVASDLEKGVTKVYADGKDLGLVHGHAEVVARLLDYSYQPGDVLLTLDQNQALQDIAKACRKPFDLQIGLAEDAGVLPKADFRACQDLAASYQTAVQKAKQHFEAGELFYAPAVAQPLDYDQRSMHAFSKLNGQAAQEYLRDHIGSAGRSFFICSPFSMNALLNLHVGESFFANVNATFSDDAPIYFGDNAKIGPNCSFYTSGLALNPASRNQGFSIAKPIHIGHNFAMGASAQILGGVTLGNNVVVAAGSVVTHSFGDNVVLAGVPAQVIRVIDPNDYSI